MQKPPCPFGPAFLQARAQTSLSQWAVAMRMGYHVRNIQRIEQGRQQPGIMLALRMVTALGVNAGDFFARLHEHTFVDDTCGSMTQQTKSMPEGVILELVLKAKSPFGPLFQQVRCACGVSQTMAARRAGYNLRNLSAVEQGKQEPGVMAALTLVAVTGCDVQAFFSALQELMNDCGHNFATREAE